MAQRAFCRAMDPQLRSNAEARLARAAQAQGLADPRPPYRERLRQLRQSNAQAFDRAIQHYEQRVLPALAESDPVPVWLDYGRFLGALTEEGNVMRIDASGRATSWTGDAPADLVLFVPSDTASDVMILCQPAAPSAAQQATLALLVDRRLGL